MGCSVGSSLIRARVPQMVCCASYGVPRDKGRSVKPCAVPARAIDRRPGAQLLTIGPPPGVSDADCGTVQALVEHGADGPFPDSVRVPVELEPGDLERLAGGEPLWLTVYLPRLVPFSVDLDPPSWHLRPHPEQV